MGSSSFITLQPRDLSNPMAFRKTSPVDVVGAGGEGLDELRGAVASDDAVVCDAGVSEVLPSMKTPVHRWLIPPVQAMMALLVVL